METVNEPSQDSPHARGLKRVHFDPEIEEHQRSYTPYKKAKKEINYVRMLRNFSHLLRGGQYTVLEGYIHSHTSEEIKEFYHQFGEMIFRSALLYSKTTRTLSFLLKEVPIETTLNILNKDQSDLARSLISVQNLLEKDKALTSGIEFFHEKMKILLSLNDEEITNAMRETVEEDDTTQNIKDTFNALNPTLGKKM